MKISLVSVHKNVIYQPNSHNNFQFYDACASDRKWQYLFLLPGGKSINASFFLYDVEEKGKLFKDNSRKTKLLTIYVKKLSEYDIIFNIEVTVQTLLYHSTV